MTIEQVKNHLLIANEKYRNGDFQETLNNCIIALSEECNHLDVHVLMSKLIMPGPFYFEYLSYLHKCIRPKLYLEIGIYEGESLSLCNKKTLSIGIDPNPRIKNNLRIDSTIYKMTSDNFFLLKEIQDFLLNNRIDLAFIDGEHLFEQVLKDFINIEKYSHKQTTILIHDCVPITKDVASRIRKTDFWCGDVWKIIQCLSKYRTDLDLKLILTPPSGLLSITKLDANSDILEKNYQSILNEYLELELNYEYIGLNLKEITNLFNVRIVASQDLIPVQNNGFNLKTLLLSFLKFTHHNST